MQVSLFSIKSVMRGTTAERKHCFGGGAEKPPPGNKLHEGRDIFCPPQRFPQSPEQCLAPSRLSILIEWVSAWMHCELASESKRVNKWRIPGTRGMLLWEIRSLKYSLALRGPHDKNGMLYFYSAFIWNAELLRSFKWWPSLVFLP